MRYNDFQHEQDELLLKIDAERTELGFSPTEESLTN